MDQQPTIWRELESSCGEPLRSFIARGGRNGIAGALVILSGTRDVTCISRAQAEHEKGRVTNVIPSSSCTRLPADTAKALFRSQKSRCLEKSKSRCPIVSQPANKFP